MLQPIKMPQIALGSEEVVARDWLVSDGDAFELGQALLEIETDKATMEVEAPFAGVFLTARCEAGDTVTVGDVIAYAVAQGADLEAARAELSQLDAPAPVAAAAVPDRAAPVPPAPAPAAVEIRFLAVEHGEIAGLPAAAAPAPTPPPGHEGATDRPLSRRRLAIARRMSAATAIPTFSIHREIAAEAGLATVAAARAHGRPITFTDVLVRACGIAGRRQPEANSWLVGDSVLEFEHVNVALAVDVPGGVVAPVLRSVDTLDLGAIAELRSDLVTRAREGRLSERDLSGGTMTLSNVAGLGSHAITPVLTPPQALALGVGSARTVGGERVVTASLVADHRLLDGADGARFLAAFAEALEAANLAETSA
jgi:pyruvate dehydrogenase E2 component (dihydrolipoamide acetyltransferase)